MLTSLSIKNVVLIDRLIIEFKSGLCVLTGETGAGKSVLLDSLGLALGVRAESGLVRQGQDSASVTAAFQIPADHGAYQILERAELEIEDDMLLLRRVLNANGKSRAFINDQPVSVALLKEIGDTLVEIHGQFETQGLLNPATHIDMLDEYAGLNRKEIQAAWDAWKTAEQDYLDLKAKAQRASTEQDYLKTALEDLQNLDPQIGEEQILAETRERLKHRENILKGLSDAINALNGDFDPVQKAQNDLDKIAAIAGQEIEEAMNALGRASAEIAEASSLLQNLSSNVLENEENLEDIDERLYALRMQARKHNCAVDDLPVIIETLQECLFTIENADESLKEKEQEAAQRRDDYIKIAKNMNKIRTKTAEKLNNLVQKELAPLKLDKAKFVTEITELDEVDWGTKGTDKVRFLVSTNPGRAPGPIHKIASGGEMSRFMLALKVIIAQAGSTHSFIFDEVDAGIGGATADAVGERLSRLAKAKQVLVVTHAPQVAARADHHWIVEKSGKKEVKTDILPLNTRAERCEEIARMLAGADITAEARAAADKLLGVTKAA